MKAVVATFNQEKVLVGAFSLITNLRMELFQALVDTRYPPLLAATSAQARPRLQLAEILSPIAGHMIAPAAPCLTVPCQLRR